MNLSLNKNIFVIGFGIVFGIILAYILFSMFFAEIPATVSTATTTQVETILPHGTKLDLKPIESHGARTNRFSLPSVDPSIIGIDSLSQLIKP